MIDTHTGTVRNIARWFVDRYATLDVRALALLRILLGAVCLIDIARRIPYVDIFYSNAGVWSNHYALFERDGRPSVFSALFALSRPWEVYLFFLASAFCALAYVVGWRTRLFQILLWVTMVSIINRNRILIYGGDSLIIALLTITLFLPLGDAWSLDSRGSRENPRHVRSMLVLVLLAQLPLLYLVTGGQKSGETWTSGDAVYYVLHQDRIVTWFGYLVRELFPIWLLRLATWSTRAVELVAPLLILSPLRTHTCRAFASVMLALFHLSIGASIRLHIFPLVMLASFAILQPPAVLDRLERWGVRILSRIPLPALRITSHDESVHQCRLSWSRELFGALLLVGSLWHALATNFLFRNLGVTAPSSITAFADYTSFRQAWGMFTPEAPVTDYNLIIDVTLSDGTHVDPRTGRAPVPGPADARHGTWSSQWDHLSRLFYAGNEGYRVELERWAQSRRGGLHLTQGVRPVHLKVTMVRDTTAPPDSENIGPLDVQEMVVLEASLTR